MQFLQDVLLLIMSIYYTGCNAGNGITKLLLVWPIYHFRHYILLTDPVNLECVFFYLVVIDKMVFSLLTVIP